MRKFLLFLINLFLLTDIGLCAKLNFSDKVYDIYAHLDSFNLIKVDNKNILSQSKYPFYIEGQTVYKKIRCEKVKKIKCSKNKRPYIYAFLNGFYLVDTNNNYDSLENYIISAEENEDYFYVCVGITGSKGLYLVDTDKSNSYVYLTIFQECH